jgi:hypothetical protein
MKPTLLIDETLMCGVLQYDTKSFKVDIADFNRINQCGKHFVFDRDTHILPSVALCNGRMSLLEFIFEIKGVNINYIYKNDDSTDLRRTNVLIQHNKHNEICTQYSTVEYLGGHMPKLGPAAYTLKNPMWRVTDETGFEKVILLCDTTDTICFLCPAALEKLRAYEEKNNNRKAITFYKHSNGYILGQNNLYIHQIIMGCFGHGRGTMNLSVDHIDGNPLNNTMQNLRIATREEQEEHKIGIKEGTKRKRNSTAKALPEGIDQSMLRKYVVYYNEVYNKEKQLKREFFKVESHPKLDKPWISSKSGKVSALEKLAAANKVVDDLANDIFPTLQESVLPQYYSLITFRDKPHLVYEQRMQDTGERRNLKMVLPPEGTYDLAEQYQKLLAKVETKYAKAAPV